MPSFRRAGPLRAPRRAVPMLLLTAASLALPTAARGNMAAPYHPGMPLGEPAAGFEQLAVVRERLTLDLRPLREGNPVPVEAVYRIRNAGAARTVTLVFVADGLARSGSGVWLDARPVGAAAGGGEGLPPSWRPPARTPLPGGGALDYATRGAGTLRFTLAFAPGEHTVRVLYHARAAAYSHDSPAVFWQLGYVLAPARAWAGFGGVDVRVLLPPGWRAASTPRLARRGDVLSAAWDRLPADALAITAQAPAGGSGPYWAGLAALSLAGLALFLLAGRRLGAALARHGRGVGWALAPASALALVWAVATGIGCAALPSMLTDRLGVQRAWTYGYGTGILALLAIPVLFAVALAAIQTAAILGGRAARRTERSPDLASPAPGAG